jgi:hypothetical protein
VKKKLEEKIEIHKPKPKYHKEEAFEKQPEDDEFDHKVVEEGTRRTDGEGNFRGRGRGGRGRGGRGGRTQQETQEDNEEARNNNRARQYEGGES